MTFWPKLRRLALACCIALFVTAVAALLNEDTPKDLAADHPGHTFVEN